MAFIIPHVKNTPIENITDDLSEEYGDMDETGTETPVYANVEKRLFEDLLQHQTKEERLNTIKELKEKNLKDQTRRRAIRRRRKAKHNGRKGRFNRNIKRYVHLTSIDTNIEVFCIIRFNCKTDSPSYIVKLLILIHHQKTRDRVAAQWLRECGNSGERRSRRNIKTTAVRYFG